MKPSLPLCLAAALSAFASGEPAWAQALLEPYGGEDEPQGNEDEPEGTPEVLLEVERRGPPAPPEIDEAVAEALLARGEVLFADGDLEGAKVLVVEAIERDPRGPRAPEALGLLRTINRRLGIDDRHDGLTRAEPGASSGGLGGDEVGSSSGTDWGRVGLASWAGGYGMTLGLALGGPADADGNLRGGAVAAGLAGAAGAAAVTYYVSGRYPLSRGQAGAIAAVGTWGAMTGGLLGDVMTGIGTSTPNQIAGFTAGGGLVGAGAGALYALKRPPSAAGVRMASSLSLYGTAAALFVGVAIDPPTGEAYSLNAAIGSTAGLGAGLWVAERFGAPSPRRMLRVDLGAGVAVAGTWLLVYPVTASARATGAISIATMAGGALGALYLTRDMDAGGDEVAHHPGPPALLSRGPGGTWTPGVPIPRPILSPGLVAERAPSLGLDLLSGRF